ncbi:MAG: endopeptidase La [Thermoanaerobaculales bacterium]|jgi:ATP-dependent Lon protease|nr:endopeptidase La [Thermoanaerobaculales bacterium]
MSDMINLPVIPLREAVLFPGVTSPIAAGRPGTLRAIEAALKTDDKTIFVVAQRENLEDVNQEVLFTMGTVATIGPVQRGPSGMRLLLNGLHRGVAMRFDEDGDYMVATVRQAEEMPPLDPSAPEFTALYSEARERASELGRRAGMPKEAVQQFLAETSEPGRFADLVAGHLELKPAEAQRLLEALSVDERLRSVLLHIQRQIDVIDAQESIKSQVQEELGDRHREAFLRQQLKAIQKELGEDGGREDLDELKAKLEELPLPEAARKEVDREMARLERMGPEGMEAQVIRTYLETICELPWDTRTDERLDIAKASEILEEDHYGLPEVKDRILEFLAVRLLQLRKEKEEAEADADAGSAAEPDKHPAADEDTAPEPSTPSPTLARDAVGRNPILLFAGPPGVGKTSVAQSIARAMGREYVRISLGGVRDEADIRGHRRTYVGAMPGRIIHGMKQAGSRNPVFLLDEVDKLGVSYQGDPGSALLEVLDPAQNDTFTDHYLGVPFDLSEVQFICTANYLQNIPGPLQDRMEVVEFAGYTENEKLEIAKRYLVPRQVKQTGLSDEQITFEDSSIQEVVTGYTRESGVRQLEREIGRLARKVARKIAAGEIEDFVVGREQVAELLGRPKVHPEHAAETDQIGVATGMYYTPMGGDIMFVEASPMAGKGNLVLTGQLGDVMKESAQAAWTYAKANADELFIDPRDFQQDVHIHVPAGAIPKDGPSAGITMATALVSALSGRPARNDVSMTGEITLSGRVLPIGGVKEKILGAVRAGISTVVLPKENEADLDDLPDEIRDGLTIHLVEELGEALAHTLRGGEFREGKLRFAAPDSGDKGGSQPLQH